jgi:hypothetical protein
MNENNEPHTVGQLLELLEADLTNDVQLIAAEVIRQAYRTAGWNPAECELGLGN